MKTLKHIFTIMILGAAIAAVAQTTHKDVTADYYKSVDDNGKTMHIIIKGTKKGGKPIKFDKTYNVKGMSKLQKDSIHKHIADSLAI